MMMKLMVSWGVIALLLVSGAASADVPEQIHYQGLLTTAAGDPIQCPDPGNDCPSGIVNMAFRIYTESQGGDPVWTETHNSVVVTNGVVDINLGDQKPLGSDLLTGQLYLGVELNGTGELIPRQAIVAAAFAMRAAEADSVGGIAAADLITAANVAGYCVTQEALDGLLSDSGYLDEAALDLYLTENGFVPGGGLIGLNCLNGQVAVYNDGDWECGNSGLAPDGLAQVSNGLLSNQFVDAFTSDNVPVGIKDFYPPGVQDVIAVPDVGVGQSMKVCVSISNSFTPDVQVTLKDPTGAEYNLYDGEEIIGGLSQCYPDEGFAEPLGDAPPFKDWFNKNPQGFWSLQVIDQGFNDVEFDGAIESWSIQMQTLSNKKVQATNDFYVQGDAYFNGVIKTENESNEVVIEGDLKVTGKITGPVFGSTGDLDEVECTENLKGQIRNYSGIFQWCNGNVWTKMNGATYRWTKWATYDQHQGWFLDNRAELYGGVAPSNWGDNNHCAHQMTDDFDLLRQFYSRSGPAIGTIKNANVYLDRHENHNSSTNSFQVSSLFRVHNSTDGDINWTVHWYGTGYGGWNEYRSVARNGENIACEGGDYRASDETSHTISIPANRTSTVIFVASGSHPSTSRTVVMYFVDNTLVLPDGLEFVDDFDVKPNGWDN